MREESQLEDMRSAIRGDFERLAERRGEQALLRGPKHAPEASEVAAAPAPEEAAPKRSWLARYLSLTQR